PSESSASAYIDIEGDNGLCGDYNHVLLSFADEQIDKTDSMAKLYLIGHMGIPFFEGLGLDIDAKYVYHQLTPEAVDTADMAETLVQAFLSGEFKDLHVIYTEIGKYGETYPVCKRILPLEYSPQEDKTLKACNDANDNIYQELVLAKIYYAVMTASLAVNYKRMAAMKQATTNGEEMIEKLRLQLNKSRQERITNELIDAIAVTFGKRV
ncbi:MAG: F0F1 ATP synthase subunit gamma, partial [Clostridia bacterium]|nr:F0F1 ATP synthase subunit gamma [Clostridia bacterium]